MSDEGKGTFVLATDVKAFGPPAAVMLAQLRWLHADARHVKWVKRDGHHWLAYADSEWIHSVGLGVDQARRARAKLEKAGVLEVAVFKKNGAPTTHIRLLDSAISPDGFGDLGESLDSAISPDPPLYETEETREGDGGDRVFSDAQLAEGQVALDAAMLCDLLAQRIEENGSKRPTVTKRWLDAARLMMTKDLRTAESIAGAINWSQQDEFWRANILSMPKLREKFDTLRLQAQRKPRAGRDLTSRRKEKTDRLAELHEERARRKATANQKGLPA